MQMHCVRGLTFNRFDICLHLCTRQTFGLEPVRHDQLSLWVQQRRSVSEKKLLVRQVTHCLRDPNAIESRLVGRGVEEVTHLLRIQFYIANPSVPQLRKSGLIDLPLVAASFLCCQVICNLHLATTYGKPDDLASVFFGQIAGRAAYATSNIENRAASGQIRPF